MKVAFFCSFLFFAITSVQNIAVNLTETDASGLSSNESDQYERIDAEPRDERTPVEGGNRKYSMWTRWSHCSSHCEQKRFRTCIHTEEKDCPHGPLHVQTRPCSRGKCHNGPKSKAPGMRQIDDLMGTSSLFEEFFFTSWSRWTMCYAKECKQYRWKACTFHPVCGDRIMVQQRPCRDKNNQGTIQCDEKSEPMVTTTAAPVVAVDEEDEDNMITTAEENQNLTCGVAFVPAPSVGTKIFGGKAATAGRWPWQVSILNHYLENYCAGTLISNWVITAAHCIRRRMYVRLGEHNILKEETTEQLFRPSKIIIHRHFNTHTIENDIAMIKISGNIKWGKYVQPICLPDMEDDTAVTMGHEGTQCMILGWGKRKPYARFGADVLHEAEVDVIEQSRCKEAYAGDHVISPRMMCAGSGRNGRSDTCEGDSGGPLLCQMNTTETATPWKLFGVTSFGDSCGKKDKYGVYTRISSFIPWINNVLTSE